MCGIAGLIHKNKTVNIGQELQDMLQALKHRGPDSTGFALYGEGHDDNFIMRFKVGENVKEGSSAVNEGSEIYDSRKAQVDKYLIELGAEVVYCGKNAADTGAGSTGPGIAERLGWASVSNVTDVSFDGGLTVTAPVENGAARISVSGNAVVSCDKGNIKVRKPNVKGIMMAKRAQVSVVSADAPSATVTIVSQTPPPAKPAGKKYEGGASAQEVAKLLRDEANVI